MADNQNEMEATEESEFDMPKFLVELHKLRGQLKFTRRDFGLILNTSEHTIDSWVHRGIRPNFANTLQILKFLKEVKQIHNAIGVFVLEDKTNSNNEPLKVRVMAERYCDNNRLKLTEFRVISASIFAGITSANQIANIEDLQKDTVTDLLFYSKKLPLPPYIINEFKQRSVKVFHHLNKRSFCEDFPRRNDIKVKTDFV